MQKIGTIQFVQIQRNQMKTYVNDERVYRPTPLLTVDCLHLTADGIMGVQEGEEIVDVHHVHHPQSRYRGDNKISLGFTHHYDAMRARFGRHMVDGIGGENIIVQADKDNALDIVGKRLFIRHDDNLIELTQVIPAPPCREFSIFCAQDTITGAELKHTLQWLDNGQRGFYAELVANDCQCYVQAGDTLLIAD